ncbi:ComEA family DNA-binding protein [Anaerotardibacter muris]|uniref:ComEA family DNA-binding protein n=1 Tax=Anaerotardibacter muris TaxID=2941505 RepID=UPI002041BFEE|nr:ComEA family DNA-binding protein [Anaerotardibacter muris]
MSFVDDVDSLKSKLHLQDIPVPLRVGLALLGAVLLFVLFQGLWQLCTGDTHLIDGSAQSSWENDPDDGLTISSHDEQVDDQNDADADPVTISVHIVGAVKNPGLYEVAQGSRIQEAVAAAGGMTSDAVEGSVNLARVIQDGEQIVVASKNDVTSSTSGSASSASAVSTANASSGQTLVNINTADAATLTTLSGIGESTAQKIIADREKNGPFKSKKDIIRVSGIGDKKYEAIKDSITV